MDEVPIGLDVYNLIKNAVHSKDADALRRFQVTIIISYTF